MAFQDKFDVISIRKVGAKPGLPVDLRKNLNLNPQSEPPRPFPPDLMSHTNVRKTKMSYAIRRITIKILTVIAFLWLGPLGLLSPYAAAQGYLFGRGDFGDGGVGSGMAAGDFNGDGRPDYAVTFSQPGSTGFVRIFLGQPDGTLKEAGGPGYAAGTTPNSVTAGDFNGDGKLDLAVANAGDNTVSLLLGNGDGTFSGPVTFSTGPTPWWIIAADFNGDGKLDLATSGGSGSTISVLLGNGDGTFQPHVESATLPYPISLAAGDFNGDGKLDLVVGASNSFCVLLGKGDGTFQAPVQVASFNGGSFALGDYNGDHILDIASLNINGGGVTIFLGKGDGTFQQGAQYASPSEFAWSIVTGDFNHDGKLDLAFTSYNGTNGIGVNNIVSVLLGKGDGTFETRADYEVGPGPTSIVAIDVNGDGHPDLIVADSLGGLTNRTPTLSVLLGNGDGTFLGVTKTYSTGTPGPMVHNGGVFSGDFNGDGKLDLGELVFDLSTYNLQAAIALSNGDGTFQAPKSTLLGSYPAQAVSFVPVVGDFNNDGKLDFCLLVTVTSNSLIVNQFRVFLGNGDGTFQAPITTQVSSVASFVVGDFNGDGKLDVAYVTPSANQVGVLLGRGDGTFGPETDFATAATPEFVTAADLNHDGKLDLVVATAAQAGSLSILLGRGDGTFPTHSDIVAGSLWPLAVGDMNGDGKLDLVSPLYVVLGNGDGTFQNPQLYRNAFGVAQIAIADMNGDGKADIITVDNNGATFSVYYGNGDGTFSSQISYSASGIVNMVVADFTGDGAQDVAVQSPPATVPGISVFLNAPTVALYPAPLNFGNQTLGVASASRDVTLYNPGSMPLTITGMAAGGDFSAADTCGSTLAVGANCNVGISFTPSADGVRNNALQLTDNAPGSPQIVALIGTGVGAPAVTGLPANLTFTVQTVGSTSSPQTMTLTNSGNAPLIITSIAAGGDFAVAASGTTCSTGSPVAAGGSCVINLTFTPTTNGPRSGSLTFTDDASGSPQSVSLSGTGTGPVVSLSSPLTFSAQLVGSTGASQTVTLTNTGSASLTFTAIAVTGPFAIASSGTTCAISTPVAALGTCTVAVTFTPSAAGAASGSLSFTDNAPGSPQSLALTGTGQDFTLAPPSGSSTSSTVAPGQPATFTLSVGGQAGLSGTVTFTCTGAPSQATCTVAPNPVTAGSSPTNVTITITTTAPTVIAPRSQPVPPVPPLSMALRGLWMLAILLVVAAWTFGRRGQSGMSLWPSTVLPITAALLLMLAMAGCGGGGSGGGGGGTTHNPGTPAGTYTLTVTGATSSGASTVSHSMPLTLTVT